jgi:hypothetical protein
VLFEEIWKKQGKDEMMSDQREAAAAVGYETYRSKHTADIKI